MKEIPITKNQIVFVDDEDYEKLTQYSWCYHGDGYAARGYHNNGKLIIEKMHQAVIGKAPDGFVIDHINGNKLDNRKCNLRYVTVQQNCFNRKRRSPVQVGVNPSKYKGVTWRNDRGKWRSNITHCGRRIYLGLYDTEEEAALAYNVAAKEIFGEYAKLNEI